MGPRHHDKALLWLESTEMVPLAALWIGLSYKDKGVQSTC